MTREETRRFSQALHTIAEETRPVSLPPDLWSRGRRQRRRRTAITVAATALILVAVVAVPTLLARGLSWTAPTPVQPRPAVPAKVHSPLPWQPTAQDSPPGPASIVVTGSGPFASSDVFDGLEDDAMVVGASGYSRTVKYNSDVESILLSPDGRYLASDGTQGSSDILTLATSVLDLTTGEVRTYAVGRPMAWSPDGRVLSLADGSGDEDGLWLVDPNTGSKTRLFRPPYTVPDRYAVAFAPDGRRLVMLSGGAVYVVDVAAASARKLADLGLDRVFAGFGAWTPQGQVTLWQRTFCQDGCAPGVSGARVATFQATYVDASTGAPVAGPQLDALVGTGARLLGWTAEGAAVVHLFHEAALPTDLPTSELVALFPGGGHPTLAQMPDGAMNVNLAGNLIRDGGFGAPSPSTPARVADVLSSHTLALLLIAAAVVSIILGVRVRRTMRSRQIRNAKPRPLDDSDPPW